MLLSKNLLDSSAKGTDRNEDDNQEQVSDVEMCWLFNCMLASAVQNSVAICKQASPSPMSLAVHVYRS